MVLGGEEKTMNKRTDRREALWCTRMAIGLLGAMRAWCWELHGERVVLALYKGEPEQLWCTATLRSWWMVVNRRRFEGPCSGAAAHNYVSEMIPLDQWIRGTFPRIYPVQWKDNL